MCAGESFRMHNQGRRSMTTNLLLVVFADIPNTAPGKRMYTLARGLSEHGCNVKLLAPMNFQGTGLRGSEEGIEVAWATNAEESDLHSTTKRIGSRLRFYKLLQRELEGGVDGVIFSNPNGDLLPAIRLANRKSSFTFATYDDLRTFKPDPSIVDYLTFAVSSVCDRIIPRMVSACAVTSTALRDRVQKIAPRSKHFLYPPIVDTNQFRNSQEGRERQRRACGVEDEILIGYLGTFWAVEGVRAFLDAVAKVKETRPKFKVIICGKAHDGLPCDDVDGIIQRLELSDQVIQKGWLPKEQIIDVMSACDILVAPKLADAANVAGMPTKLAEYMSMGKAIVTSRIGDIPMYASDGQDCLLCEPGNVKELAGALLSLLDDNELRVRLAVGARKVAESQFECKTVSSRFLKQMGRV